MNAGSAADVMHYAWPGGMEEEVVRCILRQALEGLKQVSFIFPLLVFSSTPLFLFFPTAICTLMVSSTGTSKQQTSSSTTTVPYCSVI
jgi:hypothetical protein